MALGGRRVRSVERNVIRARSTPSSALRRKSFAVDASRRIGEIPHNRSAWEKIDFAPRPWNFRRRRAELYLRKVASRLVRRTRSLWREISSFE
jgi:hypothetical protein